MTFYCTFLGIGCCGSGGACSDSWYRCHSFAMFESVSRVSPLTGTNGVVVPHATVGVCSTHPNTGINTSQILTGSSWATVSTSHTGVTRLRLWKQRFTAGYWYSHGMGRWFCQKMSESQTTLGTRNVWMFEWTTFVFMCKLKSDCLC